MSLSAALQAAPVRQPVAPPFPTTAVAQATAPRLRDYQDIFVHEVRLRFREGHKAVLLVAATGAGKTVVFSHIAHSAAGKGKRVLILAHRDQLIKQASRKLNENGVSHGIIMAGFTPNMRRLVQVASVQTLVRRVEKLAESGWKPDLIVIDEAHLSAAASYLKILGVWPDAMVLGVTGSPVRLDGKGLGRKAGGCFDIIVQGITIKELIEQGYLVKPYY
jgi:DNA repair protein RadD